MKFFDTHGDLCQSEEGDLCEYTVKMCHVTVSSAYTYIQNHPLKWQMKSNHYKNYFANKQHS